MEDREAILKHPTTYMIFGDVDKPFHRPECECESCEDWRKGKGRPTHQELRAGIANGTLREEPDSAQS